MDARLAENYIEVNMTELRMSSTDIQAFQHHSHFIVEGNYLLLILSDANGAAPKLFSRLHLFKFDFCPFQYPFGSKLGASQNSN
jgi:hypothetical protein